MAEKPSREELIQQLADKGITFDIPDDMLESIAGGVYDPSAYNPAAVADQMNYAIAEAKRTGMSKDEMIRSYIANSVAVNAQYGNSSPEYQRAMDMIRYIDEHY